METMTLTEFEYNSKPEGTLRFYVFNADGYHNGGHRFQAAPDNPQMFDTAEARSFVEAAIRNGNEVRITDSGDRLVFRAVNGAVVFPPDVEGFWKVAGV